MKPKKQAAGPASRTDGSSTIPIIEEQVSVGREIVETGRLRIAKEVTHTEEIVKATGAEEEVTVVRIPKNEYVASPPATRQEGNVTIIPVLKEVVVVEKRLLLTEELHITRERRTTESEHAVTLRREHVTVSRDEPS